MAAGPVERHVAALDPVIRRAFWGYCAMTDWPFVRMIPTGHATCPFCGDVLPEAQGVAAEVGPVRAEARRIARVEFYYSGKDVPAEQFAADVQRVRARLEDLERQGITIRTVDVTAPGVGDLFLTYNAAVIGPPAAKRAIFGMKGALLEDFGRRVPALLAFTGERERYPVEVYPRMDRQLNRVVGIEEGLELLSELVGVKGASSPGK